MPYGKRQEANRKCNIIVHFSHGWQAIVFIFIDFAISLSKRIFYVRIAANYVIVHIQMRWNHRFAIIDFHANIFRITKKKNNVKNWIQRNKMVQWAFVNTIYTDLNGCFHSRFMHINERYFGKYFTTGFTGGFYPENLLSCLLSQWIPNFECIFAFCNLQFFSTQFCSLQPIQTLYRFKGYIHLIYRFFL